MRPSVAYHYKIVKISTLQEGDDGAVENYYLFCFQTLFKVKKSRYSELFGFTFRHVPHPDTIENFVPKKASRSNSEFWVVVLV